MTACDDNRRLNAEIRHYAEVGELTLGEIGRLTGLKKEAVRARLGRMGLKIGIKENEKRTAIPISEQISGLSDSEALAHCVEVIKLLTAEAEAHDLDAIRDRFSRYQWRIVDALYQRRGRFCSSKLLHNAVFWDRPADNIPDEEILKVHVCKIRPKLPDDIIIDTLIGQGYRMRVKDRWT